MKNQKAAATNGIHLYGKPTVNHFEMTLDYWIIG